jgi:hypothetical protein
MKAQTFTSSGLFLAQDRTTKATDSPSKKGLLYRALRHPIVRPYYRLAALVIAFNAFIFFQLLSSFSLSGLILLGPTLLSLSLANFAIGIFIRQQQIINLLFSFATSIPKSWPLSVRWAFGKVYHFGGLHVGGYISGTFWFALFLVVALNSGFEDFVVPFFVKAIGVVHLLILFSVMFVARPGFRESHHNSFEIVARFGNWISLVLFWYQAIHLRMANQQSLGIVAKILTAPEIWLLGYLTFCVARPWLRLKKVPVHSLVPSAHVAISEFNYGVTPFAGSSTELSTNPLFEWHSFANIPSPKRPGFRLCISRAGDWTGKYIDQKTKHIWVKGIPAAGVGNIELLFKRVVWIATGSGVGPCIPHLLDQKVPSQLIWSTKSPRETYGDDLVNEIFRAQPNTKIWDTTKLGRPNLVDLALKAHRDFQAEAVIVISNKKLTFELNYELESRGIPCFGAIWDS